MRKEFASWCENNLILKEHIFLTGDLGFMALENVRDKMGSRFLNMGVSEQNMIGVAAGMASEGLIPLCYSIAPFCVFRPAEQIRLDICLHEHNVKIVGNGGGYGYGIMGASHHALEDYGLLSSFQSMKCFIPFANSEVDSSCLNMYKYLGPSYLRLGNGVLSDSHKERFNLHMEYSPIKKLSSGDDLVIIFVGPVGINALDAILELEKNGEIKKGSVSIFAVQEIPLAVFSEEFLNQIKIARKLLIIEEHVSRGSFGEFLALELLKNYVHVNLYHLHASGYPNKKYGSQHFHQQQSNLDKISIKYKIQEIINAKN